MNTLTRRTFSAALGLTGIGILTASAEENSHDSHGDHGGDEDQEACGSDMATPAVVPYESDIPFDLAYIDSMIPHHASVVALAETALDSLEDERLQSLAQAVLDTQPGEIEQLQQFRSDWYPDEPEDDSQEHMMELMMVTMAMDPACSHDESHMNLMDSEWLVGEYEKAEDKDLAFIDLVIPHHEMAVRQSEVGLELAEHQELVDLCNEVIEAQATEITELKTIREDIGSHHTH